MNGSTNAKIIDIHTHAFPDSLAPRAMQHLSEQADVQPYFDGTLAGLRGSMERAQVGRCVVQPIATKPSQVPSINDWAIRSQTAEIRFYGTIHPDYPEIPTELNRIHEAGIRGVKIHGDYQQLFVDDVERAFPIYEILDRLSMTVLFHAGIDIGIPEPVHATPESIAKVHAAFPELRIIAAHLGGFRQWDAVEKHLVGTSVYFDTSYLMEDIGEDQAIRIMEAHGYERILFASDGPWMGQADQIAWLHSLAIPEGAREQILWRNAERLMQHST